MNETNKKVHTNNVFISGSAHDFGVFTEKEAVEFIQTLSEQLIAQNFNIVSGFGLGVGNHVVFGALKELYMHSKTTLEDRLFVYPFPQNIEDTAIKDAIWAKYREDMISRAGVSIFLFGNKQSSNGTALADGMRSELEISVARHNLVVPVGCTGFVAEEIWSNIRQNMSNFYFNADDTLIEAFDRLNIKSDSLTMVNNIISFIKLFNNGRYSPARQN